MYARKCSDPPGGNRRGDSQPLRPIVSGGVRALASYPKKASSRSCPRTPGCSGRGRMRRGLRHAMHTFPSLTGKDEPNKHDRYISRSRGFAVLRRGLCPARYKSARAGQGPQTVGLALRSSVVFCGPPFWGSSPRDTGSAVRILDRAHPIGGRARTQFVCGCAEGAADVASNVYSRLDNRSMIPVTAPSCKQAFTTLRLLFAFSRVNKCNDDITSIATQLGPGCRGLFKRH